MAAKQTLETIDCNLCGSANKEPVMEKHGYAIVRCPDCALVFVSPRMPAQSLAENVYGPGYFDAEKGYGLEDHFGKANRLRSMKSGAERLRWIERHTRTGRLLDVGCAGGFFMLAARQRGWKVSGVEISQHAATCAINSYGLDITTGSFSELQPQPDAFDLVTMLDVIEHLPDPMRGLLNAFTTLKPGGSLFVATPNFDSLPARTLGREWGLVEPEHHLFYFTPATLERMVEKAGFKVVEKRFPLLGLNDLLLSAGAIRKAGIPVGEQQKAAVRKHLKLPRAAARAILSAADTAVFAPLFANNKGVIIEIIATKI
jgi:SAM-dependent methyltransferase